MALESFAQRLYDVFIPLNGELDVENFFALQNYCAAIGEIFQEVDTLARDTPEGYPGWSIILDANRCPVIGLPWLAQWTGTTLSDSWSEADQRTAIQQAGRWARGTPTAMTKAIQTTLTGNKQVFLTERDTSPYHFSVFTLTGETPNSAASEAALLSQKPAGLAYSFNTLAAWSWYNIRANYADWNAVKIGKSSWQAVRNNT